MRVRTVEKKEGEESQADAGALALLRRFWRYVRPYKTGYFIVLFLNVFGAALGLLPPYILKYLLDDVLPSGRYRLLWYLMGVAMGGLLLQAAVNAFRTYWGHVIAQKVCYDARNALFSHMQKLSMTFHDNERTGRLLSRVVDDLNLVQEVVFHGPETILVSGSFVIGAAVLMFCQSAKLALVSLAVVPLLALFTYLVGRQLLRGFKQVRKKIADVSARVEDNLTGIQVIKSFVREEYEDDRFAELNRAHFDSRLRVLKYMAALFPGGQLLNGIGLVATLGYGGHLLMSGGIEVGDLAMFVYLLVLFHRPILNLSLVSESLASFLASLERFFAYMDIEPEAQESEKGIELEEPRGEVVFEDVHFGYDALPVLKGASLRARPGEMVALVGPSGAGKTTTISLISRFYTPQSGRITIDGHDTREIRLRSLRSHIGIVMQDDHLFADTVRENIAYGKLGATEEEIVAAAEAANAHDFITALPNGYDTNVGQRGVKLSEGQKQRVSIARAILKDPKILLLDEATSSVDSASELLIQKAFQHLRKGRTTFVIAHRLSTVLDAEQILFMQDGRIVERGTHQELIRENGLYKRFYEAQFTRQRALGA